MTDREDRTRYAGRAAGGVELLLVAAAWYLSYTLFWAAGPFERIGWFFPGLFLGVPLLVLASGYLVVAASHGRRVTVPALAIVVAALAPAVAAGTGVIQKARWAHARSVVAEIAAHPPAPGTTEYRRLGTFDATVHTNRSGTVLVSFPPSWDGLLYVPPGQPAPARTDLRIGDEVMPHWWYFDTD